MKRLKMVMVAFGLMFTLSLLLVAPHAQAVTKEQVAPSAQSVNAEYTFILGEDGGVWYTVSSLDVLNRTIRIGNANNPFQALATTVRGTVSSSALSTNCTLSGFTCSGLFAKVPGAGTFLDGPVVMMNAPYVSGAANGSVLNIIATGQDNNIWYTVYDAPGNGSTPGGILGTSAAGSFIPNEAFSGVGESNDTGHPLATNFSNNCTTLARTCVGLWEMFQ